MDMDIELTIKNYRPFSENNPLRLSLRKGFTSFVGTNNSGKSSILKFFYEFRQLFTMLANPDQISHALRGVLAFNYPSTIFDPEEVFHNLNIHNLIIEIKLEVLDVQVDPKPIPIKLVATVARGKNEFSAIIEIAGSRIELNAINIDSSGTFRSTKPIALDLHPLMDACILLSKTLYIGAFRNALNLGDQPNYFDISAGQSFIKQWRRIKEGKLKKENQAAIKLTEDIRRIFDYKTLEINTSDGDETLSVAIDGQSYKLPELGSGLTQFIIVLANASIAKPAYILIDEPELNLHPSLQLDFLTTLASYSTEGILFATHSIGLARSSSDFIYSVHKKPTRESSVRILEDTPKLPEFLGEMSFSGYEELGFNKVLLSEGVTDAKALQQFLRFYKKEHKVVILPLGGNQLINDVSYSQLKEVKRISKKVFGLIDSEKDSQNTPLDPKRKKFTKNCQRAGIKCHVLKYRALENYLTQRAVNKVKGEKYRALQPFEKREGVDPIWSKQENWRIAREMTKSELEKTDLGQFLAKL